MAVEICAIGRVLSVLRTSTDETEAVQPSLDATIEWVQETYNTTSWGLDPGTSVVEKFFNVRSNEILTLSDQQPQSITLVQVFPREETFLDSIFLLAESNFQLLPKGKLQLLMSDLVAVPGVEFVYQKMAHRVMREVDVTYVVSGIVPKNGTEAIALIAAAAYQQQPTQIAGMKSERIGEYSYAIDPDSIGAVPEAARRMLRPFTRHQRARMV